MPESASKVSITGPVGGGWVTLVPRWEILTGGFLILNPCENVVFCFSLKLSSLGLTFSNFRCALRWPLMYDGLLMAVQVPEKYVFGGW